MICNVNFFDFCYATTEQYITLKCIEIQRQDRSIELIWREVREVDSMNFLNYAEEIANLITLIPIPLLSND